MRKAIALGLVSATAAVVAAQAQKAPEITLWPENQRAFVQDGPGLLLQPDQLESLVAMSVDEREAWMEEFLATDPVPETELNELTFGIDRRRRLVHLEYVTLVDARARLLFLNGAPLARELVDCGQAFLPIEIWDYGDPQEPARLVLFQPSSDRPYRLWVPSYSKAALYTSEMRYWLQQYEELKGLITARRFDIQLCKKARLMDKITGIEGLYKYKSDRPDDQYFLRFIQAPRDLTKWARKAAVTPLERDIPTLETGPLDVVFPDRFQQRMVARYLITIPSSSQLGVLTEGQKSKHVLAVDGGTLHQGRIHEDFRILFEIEKPEKDVPIYLAFERALRADRIYTTHIRVTDEVDGSEAYLSKGFQVPTEPQEIEEPVPTEEAVIALGQQLARQEVAGADSLVLIPPPAEIVLGLWRAEALVTGARITKVRFDVDGQTQMTRNGRPFSAELRLSKFPVEQIVTAVGLDENGEVVASDEVILNQPRGALRVRIVAPERGVAVAGRIEARAEIVVPEDKRVENVEFKVNEQSVAILKRPPWRAEIEVPLGGSVSYLSVTATLDDGSRAEEVRFLNAPEYLEEVDVKLVELYTTVTDKSGRLARGLTADDFVVKEDGRPQTLSKFELVEDLPLTLGIVIDTSGSMAESLGEAKLAALGFLENMITLRDKVFALSFSSQPALLIPATEDVEAVEESLEDLVAAGMTTLHDAVVTGLYYFRGVRGRRALILLSDGDDTASSLEFGDAIEYARRSGVSIYTIGLGVGGLNIKVKNKLTELAKETGGRNFMIAKASELTSVYREIEEELRSQYLLAYSSDRPSPDGEFREIEVKVSGGKYKARTIRGYYP